VDSKTYKKLYPQIKEGVDFEKLAKHYDIRKKSLEMILLQKIVRGTMKTHGRVKSESKKLAKRWARGESFTKLAHENEFPPIMMASIIMQEKGVSKKRFAMILRDTSLEKDTHTRRELEKALEKDEVYSPRGAENMTRRGKRVEKKVGDWLDSHKVEYETEKESQALGRPKTPDFLLKTPFDVGGFEVNWFECKGSYGDKTEYNRDYRKQLRHYVDLYGPGLVVYWYGFLTDIETDKVVLTSKLFFKNQN